MHTTAQGHVCTEVAGRDFGSKTARWTGRAFSTVAVLFLAFDSVGKLLQVEPVVAGTMSLGYPASVVFGLGVTLLLCVLAYVIPGTSVLGAVLLTGYLGGAVAAHVRVESPLFSHVLFPTYVAALLWGGLLLRDARVRALVPLRGNAQPGRATRTRHVTSHLTGRNGHRVRSSWVRTCADPRKRRVVQPIVRSLGQPRAAARAALHRVPLRPPRARAERRHAALCLGA